MEIIKAYRYVFTLRKIRSSLLNLSYLVPRFILGKFISKIKDINKLIKECQKLVKHQIAVT